MASIGGYMCGAQWNGLYGWVGCVFIPFYSLYAARASRTFQSGLHSFCAVELSGSASARLFPQCTYTRDLINT